MSKGFKDLNCYSNSALRVKKKAKAKGECKLLTLRLQIINGEWQPVDCSHQQLKGQPAE